MKNNVKTIIASALSALVFASVSIGTTFALFTDNKETDVSIHAGKISLTQDLNVAIYSMDPLDNSRSKDEPVNEDEGVYSGTFETNGTFSYNSSTGVINLNNIVPGDGVRLTISPDSTGTTVSIKYRFSFTVAKDVATSTPGENEYPELARGLATDIKVGDEDAEHFSGLVNYQSAWEVKNPEDEYDDILFDISLPKDKGNQYQGGEPVNIAIALEAIQSNAYTDDDENSKSAKTIEENLAANNQVTSLEEDSTTVISAGDIEESEDKRFEVALKNVSTYNTQDETGKAIALDDTVELKVTKLETTESQQGANQIVSLNFDAKLIVNDEPANNFSEPVEVRIFVGEGKAITGIKHNNDVIDEYTYVDGYVIFATTSFSPFSVEYLGDGCNVKTLSELNEAIANNVIKVIILDNDIEGASSLNVTRNLTLIGNGHTLTASSSSNEAIRLNANQIEVRLENITLDRAEANTQFNSVSIAANNCNLIIKHSTLKIGASDNESRSVYFEDGASNNNGVALDRTTLTVHLLGDPYGPYNVSESNTFSWTDDCTLIETIAGTGQGVSGGIPNPPVIPGFGF